MAIVIPHRFKDRISSPANKKIDTIIIGTFNPGLPITEKLSASEIKEFSKISSSSKFQKFNQIQNFYDRSQNRFWKVMDVIYNSEFYSDEDLKKKNPLGLKYFSGMDRAAVLKRQLDFCFQNNIWITDIVSEIRPKTFLNIYDYFPDTFIEKSDCEFNTNSILKVIKSFKVKKVVFTFRPNRNSIPKISRQIQFLIANSTADFNFGMSTSGAAKNTYERLVKDWKVLLDNE